MQARAERWSLGRQIRGALFLGVGISASVARAGVVFGLADTGLGGGYRWDAVPRIVNVNGTDVERSLDGGLRYSVQGGSYEAFRDQFTWGVVPSVADFTAAVQAAFHAWTVPDPATGLTTPVRFVEDFATPVVGSPVNSGYDGRGAEIDLLAGTSGASWSVGSPQLQGETSISVIDSPVTLTTGAKNYPGSGTITGVDIAFNNNPQALYALDTFRRLLTHELGHALGLGDAEGTISPNAFIDDNYDGSTSASAAATLNNSWALLVDPFNPADSPLGRYTIPFSDPGTLSPGVDLLMESNGLGISFGNPVTNLVPLTNDEFGTRQFLYPSLTFVPEPATAAWLGAGIVGLLRRRGRALPRVSR